MPEGDPNFDSVAGSFHGHERPNIMTLPRLVSRAIHVAGKGRGTRMSNPYVAFIESNTSGMGMEFIRVAAQELGFKPVLLLCDPTKCAYTGDECLEVVHVDTANAQTILRVCRQLQSRQGLAGVVSFSE